MQVVPEPQVAQVVAVGGGAQALDAAAFSNLANVTHLQLKQGNVFWEAATGGCVPNTYMVRTRDPEHQIQRSAPDHYRPESESYHRHIARL